MARQSHQVMQEMRAMELTDLSFIRPVCTVFVIAALSPLSPRSQHLEVIGSDSLLYTPIQPKQTRPSNPSDLDRHLDCPGMATLAEELTGASASVGFVGAGNMAWAIFQNILASGITEF